MATRTTKKTASKKKAPIKIPGAPTKLGRPTKSDARDAKIKTLKGTIAALRKDIAAANKDLVASGKAFRAEPTKDTAGVYRVATSDFIRLTTSRTTAENKLATL